MDTVLSEMTGIVSEVEVNVDASDIPTVAPNPELDLCNVCGNTPCKFVDYKDEIFDTVIGHLFQAFPPCIDQLNAAVTTPLDQEELETICWIHRTFAGILTSSVAVKQVVPK